MKKLNKILLSLSFTFVVSLSIGIFLTIEDMKKSSNEAFGEMTESFYLDTNGGEIEGTTSPTQSTGKDYLVYDDIYKVPNPTKTGYTFTGWVPDDNFAGIVSNYGYIDDRLNSGFFNESENNISVYNNLKNGNVIHEFVSAPEDLNFPVSNRVLQITSKGEATPGLGGFTNNLLSEPQTTYYQVIHAKIPVGYHINAASNAHGNNPKDSWLTNNYGTGKWETYVYKWDLLDCNEDEGTYSTIGFFYLSGKNATAANPVVWQVAYLGTFGSHLIEQAVAMVAFGEFTETDLTGTTVVRFPGGSKKIVALWSAKSYKVTLDNTFITGGMDVINVNYGFELPKISIPFLAGEKCVGYFTEPDGKGVQYFDSEGYGIRAWDIDGDTTLYPYFIYQQGVQIVDGETLLSREELFDNTLFALPAIEHPGKIFKGWEVTGGGKIVETQFLKESKTFNGTSDFVNLGRDYMYTDKFTFSCKAYSEDWSYYEKRWEVGIISSTESGGWNIENIDGYIVMACYERNNGYKNAVSNVRWSSLSAGWHQFGCVFDGTYATLYLDGEKIAQSERYSNGIYYHSSNSMILGGEAGSGSTPTYYFKGQLKNVVLIHDAVSGFGGFNKDDQNYYYISDNSSALVTANWISTWESSAENISLVTDENGNYLISKPQELGRVAYEVNELDNNFSGKVIKLTSNIDLKGNYWLPIGRNKIGTDVFKGTFDGQEFSILNLKSFNYTELSKIDLRSEFAYMGLFGKIENATIKNVHVTVDYLIANERCGGVTGYAEMSTIENCMVSPSETGAGMIESYWEAAGICGYSLDSKLENCINKCNLKGRYTGGIVGRIYQNKGNTSSITKCINFGDIGVSSLVEGEYSGGIVAITDGCKIYNSINYGKYSANYLHAVGGLAGWLREDSYFAVCANYGSIAETSGKVVASSALVGRNSGVSTLVASFAQSKLASSSNSSNLFVSMNSSTFDIDTCYAKVDIGSTTYKHVYGTAENLNTYFRYKQGVNNDMPIVIELFEYAQQMEASNDILSEGFAGFEHVG